MTRTVPQRNTFAILAVFLLFGVVRADAGEFSSPSENAVVDGGTAIQFAASATSFYLVGANEYDIEVSQTIFNLKDTNGDPIVSDIAYIYDFNSMTDNYDFIDNPLDPSDYPFPAMGTEDVELWGEWRYMDSEHDEQGNNAHVDITVNTD